MNQKTTMKILLVVACCGLLLFALSVFLPHVEVFFDRRQGGQMQIEVFDGDSNTPIENAVVVIPEAKIEAATDSSGKTEVLTLPLLHDARFSKILPKTWGEVTILVYKDGYAPYILVDAQVFENQIRQGPVVYLFSSGGNDTPYAIVEGPERSWVDDMVAKYKPKTESLTASEKTPAK